MRKLFPKKKFPRIFFRYNHCHFWDHLAHLIIIKLELQAEIYEKNNEEPSDEFIAEINDHWAKINSIAELLEDNDSIKLVYLICQAGINYTTIYIKSNFNPAIRERYLGGFRKIILLPSY